jgi:hypothetical protein
MKRATIDCSAVDWIEQLGAHLCQATVVDLINFDLARHGHDCEVIAKTLDFEFLPDRDLTAKIGHFRRKEPPTKQP